MKVIKRDGSTADFDSSKIIVAIQKANQVVEPEDRIDQERIEAIAHYVESKNRMRLLVEDIQDMVETGIMELRGYGRGEIQPGQVLYYLPLYSRFGA